MRITVAQRVRHDRDEVLSFLQAPSAAGDVFIRDIAEGVRHLSQFPETAVRRRD